LNPAQPRRRFGGGALLALALASTVAVVAAGCGKKESIVAVGDGKKLTAEEIDADPLALLPGGAIALAQLDAASLMSSQVGPQTVRLASRVVPLTPEMGFDPKRDLKTIAGGAYSMQGADAVFVATGTFDTDAIRKAADKEAITALGKPLKKTTYAGNDLYLTGDVGLVLLTSHTILGGNPAGMRRALDRLRDGRIKREIPDWMADLLKTPDAKMALAGDFKEQAVPAAIIGQAPFLRGLQRVRVLGDFNDPGMNYSGALTYPDGPSAAAGEGQIKQVAQMSSSLNYLSMFGISSPLKTLNTNVAANDVQFVAAIDGPALARLLDSSGGLLPQMFGVPAAPAPAPSGAAPAGMAPGGAPAAPKN
jgi:hypothetical protein